MSDVLGPSIEAIDALPPHPGAGGVFPHRHALLFLLLTKVLAEAPRQRGPFPATAL